MKYVITGLVADIEKPIDIVVTALSEDDAVRKGYKNYAFSDILSVKPRVFHHTFKVNETESGYIGKESAKSYPKFYRRPLPYGNI